MSVPDLPMAAPAGYPEYPTIVHALAAAADLQPGAPAIYCGGRELTYAQYAAAIGAFARRLIGLGATGERVAYLIPNSLEAAVAMLGGLSSGAQVAPMNFAYTDPELIPLMHDVAPRVLVCDAALKDRAGAIASELGIAHVVPVEIGGGFVDGLLAEPAGDLPLPGALDPSLIFFTGGTTGVPKGASHIHRNEMAFCYEIAAIWPFPLDTSRMLNVAPLFHVWGFCFTLVFPVYIRAFMDLMPAYKPALVLEEFEKRRISVFNGGPAALYMGLRANENYRTTDFSAMEICLSGGAPCPEELLRGWEAETGCVILEGWGMSEGAPIHSNPLNGVRKIRSVGVTPPHTRAEVVDLETGTRVLPTGEAGEIRIRGAQFVSGYRNRPEENAQAFRDGWFYTGDIGYYDEDGYMFLVDRKKEMCIVGGYNVYPREIDELLFKHPAVLEAATIGVPDAFSGEAIKACVVLKPGQSVDEEQIKDYCRRSLVKYKVPTQVEFLDALPKSGVGKIDKRALKRAGT